MCLAGDFNEQLQANVQGVTGKWTGGQASANSDKIISFLRLNNLLAANTTFKPKKHKNVCTFLQTVKQGGKDDSHVDDQGAYVNRAVKAKYRRKWIPGVVEARLSTGQGQPRWVVRFKDGHVSRCSKKEIRKMFVHEQRTGHSGGQTTRTCVRIATLGIQHGEVPGAMGPEHP